MDREELLRRVRRLLETEKSMDQDHELLAAIEAGDLPRWLDLMLHAAEVLPLPEVPPIVSQDLRRMMDPPALVEHHQLTLVRDGRSGPKLAGVRGGKSVEGWVLLYASDRADVVIDVWPDQRGAFELEGQVVVRASDRPTAYRASLRGPVDVDVSSDWLGRFRLGAVPPGRYELRAGDGRVEFSADVELEPVA